MPIASMIAGKLGKRAVGVGKKALGFKGSSPRRRRKSLVNRLINAKINAKIMKTKLSVINSIK